MYRREHKKQLSLQFLGFNSEAIFYINEHYLIFKEALRMKKPKVLTAVFTRRGLVDVRCTRREGVFSINSVEELSSINHSPIHFLHLSLTLRLDLKLIAFVLKCINCILLIKIDLILRLRP